MPPGGPVDETPPTIVEVFPPSGSVNLSSRQIVINFSEYMNEASFKKNITVFPRLEMPLEFSFKGDKIILTLPDLLESEKTYIIYLNRNIQDEHKIRLAKTIQLAYSTGEKISKGVVAGKVYGLEEGSIHLWEINSMVTDSLFATQPDYITDVNDNGHYSFSYLSNGHYKVLAVEKSGTDLPLSTEHMRYGLYWQEEINLVEDDTLSNINIRTWKESQKLKLLRGEWSAFDWGRLVFNNDIPNSIDIDLFIKTENGEILDSLVYYQDSIDPKNLIVQVSDSLTQNSLNVNIVSLELNDELLLDSSEVVIQIPQEPDTSYLQILKPTLNFQIYPNDLAIEKLDIIFSKPVQLFEDSLYLPKLFKNDSVAVDMIINQITPMEFQLTPLIQWEENEKYQLTINRDGILAKDGRGLEDSVFVINLRTNKSIGYGTVNGKINETEQSNIVAELFSVKNPSLSQTSFVNSKSEFEFETIPEGNYSLYFYKDDDNNMKYSFGNAYQNIPCEWFYFYPDTFEVRANWETEIAPINLPGVN